MIDFEKQFGSPDYALGAKQTAIAKTFRIVYGWMAAGLVLSGLVAWQAFESGLCIRLVANGGMTACLIGELVMVLVLAAAINKLPVMVAYALFAGYAVLNGLTLSTVFLCYDLGSITQVFFITAGMFGGLAVWGTVTKGDLTSVGSICGMGLWGLIIASLVNIFVGSAGLDWLISFAGIIVFTGLTMYDAQKIKQLAAAEGRMDSATLQRVGILGALNLYLDFVNLFLYILRFLGRRK